MHAFVGVYYFPTFNTSVPPSQRIQIPKCNRPPLETGECKTMTRLSALWLDSTCSSRCHWPPFFWCRWLARQSISNVTGVKSI